MAIGKAHFCRTKHAIRAAAVEAARLDEDFARFAAVRAGVHPQRAADRAGHAAQEGETVDARLRRGARHLRVERRGAGDDAAIRPRFDRAEPFASQANHQAAHAAVAHDQVGADADDQ